MGSDISGVNNITGLGALHAAFIMVLFCCPLDTFRLAAVALDSCVWWVHVVCVVMVRPAECMVHVTGHTLLSIETLTSECVAIATQPPQLLALCK